MFCAFGRKSNKVFMEIFVDECKLSLRILLEFLAERNIKMVLAKKCKSSSGYLAEALTKI